jgi:preprotein translocase subunit YajC
MFKLKSEDWGFAVGLIALYLLLLRTGIEKTIDLILTFVVSITVFYFIAEKIKRKYASD